MNDNLPPLAPRDMRTRVAVPVEPPVLKPSLIPNDVMQELRREAQVRRQEREDQEPHTAPVNLTDDPDAEEVAVLAQVDADPEVALFALSKVPLFKDLPIAELEQLATGAQQIDVPAGEVLFLEGDEASSFYVVIDGALEVVRQKDGREVALRHTQQGEAFGLFGLLAGQMRTATARAIGEECTVLEVSAEKLQALVEQDEKLHTRLLNFYRERLIESFMAGKMFSDLIDSIARARLIGRFRSVNIDAGTALLSPGEVSNLIAVVTHGHLVLEERARPGQAPVHFEIAQGQFLAVTCALSGTPSRMKVFAPEHATVSLLDQKDLNELLRDYPSLRALPSRLPNFARKLERDVYCGTAGIAGL